MSKAQKFSFCHIFFLSRFFEYDTSMIFSKKP